MNLLETENAKTCLAQGDSDKLLSFALTQNSSDNPKKTLPVPRSTVKDIALMAEVSPMTVSRVLRGVTGHNAKTVGRVLAAAEKLNYRPSLLARTLRTGKTFIVGCFVPELPEHDFLGDLFFSQIMLATESALSRKGFRILIVSLTPEEIRTGSMPDVVKEGFIQSAIAIGIKDLSYLRSLQRQLHTLVTADFLYPDLNGVASANYRGGEIAAESLWALGHRRFAILDGSEEDQNYRARREGFINALGTLSGKREHVQTVRGDEWHDGGGRRGVADILLSNLRPTAIFCVNDHLALDALKELESVGLTVPGDISVCGFDDMLLSVHSRPSLTTIAVDKIGMGRMAAEILASSVESDEASYRHVEMPVTWIPRESTSAPPIST